MLHKHQQVVYYKDLAVVVHKQQVVKALLMEKVLILVVMVNQVHCFKAVMLLTDVRQNPTLKKVVVAEAATTEVVVVHQDIDKVVDKVMQVVVEEVVHSMDILKLHQVQLVLLAIQKVVVKVAVFQNVVTLLKQEKVVVQIQNILLLQVVVQVVLLVLIQAEVKMVITGTAASSAVSTTIISNAFTASSAPSTSRIVVFQENIDTPTLNTDLIASVSRDGGTTFTTITLADEGYITGSSGQRILAGVATISGQPSGTSMRWKLALANNQSKIHGVSLSWA
jgi:hypothetical protein